MWTPRGHPLLSTPEMTLKTDEMAFTFKAGQPLQKVPVGAITPKSPSQPCSLAPRHPTGQPGELKMDGRPYLPGSCEDTDHGHPALASAQLLRFPDPPPPA